MRWLYVTHPRTDGHARIAASALPYHLRAGWVVVPQEPSAVPEPAGTDTGDDSTPETSDDAPPAAPSPRTSRRPAGNDENSL